MAKSRYSPAAFDPLSTTKGLTIPAPVSSSFCVPYFSKLFVMSVEDKVKKGASTFIIKDSEGNLHFDVKRCADSHTYRNKLALHDQSGDAVVFLKQKVMTFRERWNAYSRDKEKDHDHEGSFLFSMIKSGDVRGGTKVFHVFLSPTNVKSPDFVVIGAMCNYNVTFKNVTIAKAAWSGTSCELELCPGVDHAFIVAIVSIMDIIDKEARSLDGTLKTTQQVVRLSTGDLSGLLDDS